MSLSDPWTIGVVRHGMSDGPSRHTPLPDKCADHGHPSSTYNPWADKTWCLCGEIIREGNTVTHPKPTACGQPLSRCNYDACPTVLWRARDRERNQP